MQFPYQLFLSHGPADAEFAHELARELDARGLKAWVDREDMTAGDVIGKAVDGALAKSEHFLVLVSATLSEWQWVEISGFMFATKLDPKRRRFAVRRTDHDLPSLLGSSLAIDARTLSPAQLAEQLDELLTGSRRSDGTATPTITDAVKVYRERLVELHRHLVPFRPELSDVLLEQACVELEVTRSERGMRELGLSELGDREGKDHSLRSLIERTERTGSPARWLVEGEPGAGKTTIARNLARQLAADPNGPFPVFVSAIRLAELRGDLFKLATELLGEGAESLRAGPRDRLKAALANAWLLIDGFDEVPATLAEYAYAAVATLTRDHRGPIAVLSRLIAFEKREPWPGFQRAVVKALDEPRQRRLIENLVGIDLVEPILAVARSNSRITDLAKNPLLLSLLSFVARDALRDRREIPSDDGRLMSETIDLLLERGHALVPRKVEDVVAAREILGAMSFELHRRGGENWPKRELSRLVWDLRTGKPADVTDGARIDHQVQSVWRNNDPFIQDLGHSGVIGPHDGERERWRYFHRSMREYLAAERLLTLPVERARQIFEEFLERPHDPQSDADQSWVEVFRFWLSLSKASREDHERLGVLSRDTISRSIRRSSDLAADDRLKLALDADKDDGVDLLGAALAHPEPDVAAELVLERAKPEIATEQAGRLLWTLERLGREPKDFFARIGRKPAPNGLIEFVEIPAGTFEMGADPKIDGDEDFMKYSKPLHRVSVARFALGKTQVTRAQYHVFDAKHESRVWKQVPKDEVDRLPVTDLTWWEAYLFSRWIGGRLPSEAEWEYACRANTKERMRYSFGDAEETLAENAWYFRNSGVNLLPLDTKWDREKVDGEWAVRPHPVGSKPANPFALFDMHGNVWEWCADSWHDDYESAPKDSVAWIDPASPLRVLRGGSFWYAAGGLRSASRNWDVAGLRFRDLGFRPARPLSP